MNSLRSRFILSHLLPVLVVVPLAGIALVYILETQLLLNDLSEELSRQASLVSDLTYGRPEIWSDPEEAQIFVTDLSRQFQGCIVLLQPSGTLMASSSPDDQTDRSGPVPDDLLKSGEHQIELSFSLSRQSAAVLIPILDVDQEVVGIIRITRELEGLAVRFS